MTKQDIGYWDQLGYTIESNLMDYQSIELIAQPKKGAKVQALYILL